MEGVPGGLAGQGHQSQCEWRSELEGSEEDVEGDALGSRTGATKSPGLQGITTKDPIEVAGFSPLGPDCHLIFT